MMHFPPPGLFDGLGLGLGAMPKYTKSEEEMVQLATQRATERVATLLKIAVDASATAGIHATCGDQLLYVTSMVFEDLLGRVRMEHHIPDETEDGMGAYGGRHGLSGLMRKPVDIRPMPLVRHQIKTETFGFSCSCGELWRTGTDEQVVEVAGRAQAHADELNE